MGVFYEKICNWVADADEIHPTLYDATSLYSEADGTREKKT